MITEEDIHEVVGVNGRAEESFADTFLVCRRLHYLHLQRHLSEDRKIPRGKARACAAMVLTVSHVEVPVQIVLYRPVAPDRVVVIGRVPGVVTADEMQGHRSRVPRRQR